MATFDAETGSWDKEEACIELTNHLIVLCKLSFPRVSSLSDITSQLFILLFEKITGIVPHDLITEPQSVEHEAHNIQIIIDTLSLDILNISLSHITGEDIIACNALSIYNLLEILENFLLYPSAEESRTTTSEFPIKDKPTSTFSNSEQHEASLTRQSMELEKLPSSRCPQEVASYMHTDHLFKQDDKVSAPNKHFDKICPLCTFANKEITDLNNENKNATSGNTAEIPLRESSQSSMTAYQALPEKLGEPVSLKFLSNETLISFSSPPAQEQATTESSSSVSPLGAQHYSSNNNILNPEFAKIGLQSEHDKSLDVNDPIQSSHLFMERELQDLQNGNGSNLPFQEPAQQIQTTEGNILQSEEQAPIPTYSSNKLPVKKNVRFSSQHASGNHNISNESMKKRYAADNKRYFEERLKNCMEDLESVAESSDFVNSVYDQMMFDLPKKLPPSPYKKNVYCPSTAGHNTTPKRIRKTHHRRNTRNSLEQENLIQDNQFLQVLQQEFPYVYLSPASVRRMQQQYNHHIRTIENQLRDAYLKKSRTQIQYEEAEKRKAILSGILQKEVAHNRRMRLLREQRQNYQRARTALRDNQQSRVQMKQLHNNYQQYIKQKIMRKRSKEERLLSRLYQDGLSIHKEELRELRQRAKEREEEEAKKNKNYLDSMENFYQSQFALLAESLAEEKENLQQRTKAQARVLDQMRHDYRRQMENEVKAIQEQLVQDDDIHFREMDAERIRQLWHKKGVCPFYPRPPARARRRNRQLRTIT